MAKKKNILAEIEAWSKERGLVVDILFCPDLGPAGKYGIRTYHGRVSGSGATIEDAWAAALVDAKYYPETAPPKRKRKKKEAPVEAPTAATAEDRPR